MNTMTKITKPKAVELLTFRIGEEDYAIDISTVREIRGWTTPAPMPDAPDFVVGLINLRGTVLPLFDLAGHLELSTSTPDERSVIIVAEVEQTQLGLIVDAVSDIIAPATDDMQPPPETAMSTDTPLVQSLTFVEDSIVRVLDLPVLLSSQTGMLEKSVFEDEEEVAID